MSSIQIKVGEKEYNLEPELAFKCAYIKNIYTDTLPEGGLVIGEITEKGFQEVLKYLKNDQYHFPVQYQDVLDFLGVEYTKKNLYDQYQQKCSSIACTRILLIESSIYDYEETAPKVVFCPYHKCHAQGCKEHCFDYDREINDQHMRYCKIHKCANNDCKARSLSNDKFCSEHTLPSNSIMIGYGSMTFSGTSCIAIGYNAAIGNQKSHQMQLSKSLKIDNGVYVD